MFGDSSLTGMIAISDIEEAPTIVRGSVQARDSSQQEAILSRLEGTDSEKNGFIGYNVVSASYKRTFKGSPTQETTLTEDFLKGVAVGVVGAVIIGLVIWRARGQEKLTSRKGKGTNRLRNREELLPLN